MGLNVIMLGPPGAGKGTQAERLAKRLGVPRVSTGDILREAVSAGSDLGRQVQAVMSRGELVGDALMVEVVRERICRPDAAAGFVLDGFPRTIAQADALETLLEGRGAPAVVELVVPEDELVRRLSARRVCAVCGVNAWAADTDCAACGGRLVQRDDDTAEVVRERLDAMLPRFITEGLNVQFYFGGTSTLIVVGVAMDTVQQVESQLIMRHYDGFMKKTRMRGRRG